MLSEGEALHWVVAVSSKVHRIHLRADLSVEGLGEALVALAACLKLVELPSCLLLVQQGLEEDP